MNQDSLKRIRGLDGIRFICALWVVLDHLVLLRLYREVDPNNAFEALVRSLGANTISGAAAVIAFFVISGLCIHFPYRESGIPNLAGYYASRYVRIGLPLVAAILLARMLGLNYSFFEISILWSLFAELVYYTIYPLLVLIKSRIGWSKLMAAAFLGAFAVIFGHPPSHDYPVYGLAFNWLVGLPCWLLGCLLAERVSTLPLLTSNIWLWRAGVWLASCMCIFLRFHTPIGFPITLTLFAVVVAAWLRREIAHFQQHTPVPWLEALGAFSYSVYLVHLIGSQVFKQIQPAGLGYASYVAEVAFAIGFSYLFYRLVERPAHQLARKLKGLSWPAPARKLDSRPEAMDG